jgi:hypothetical protein
MHTDSMTIALYAVIILLFLFVWFDNHRNYKN